jgi:hypothetical protein
MHLVLVLVAAVLATQPAVERANFTGSWKMVAARSESPTQTTPVTEMTFVIDHAADQIRLDMTSAGRTVTANYPIVAAPRTPADPIGGDERRAYWDGTRLVVERGGTISGQTVSSRQALTLNEDGSEMTVERLVIVQHGYTLRGAKNYATVKDVFARVPR